MTTPAARMGEDASEREALLIAFDVVAANELRTSDINILIDRILAAGFRRDPGWIALADNLPSYNQKVWCYWPGRFRDGSEPGMQGCAVRSIELEQYSMKPSDRWHAEDDYHDGRFAPTHWMPLPPPPARSEGEGA